MSTPEPFVAHVPEESLAALHDKLTLARFPDELEGAGWDYGVPLADVRRLVAYWKDGFDWRKQEAYFNTLPQFTTDVEVKGFGSLNIHFVHQRSAVDGAIPLLFSHGWPGSFLEVTKLLPLLTSASPEHPSFHVVTFSLPGFGYSEAPKQKGFAIAQYAEVGHKLMQSLGYIEYVTQGGDWGSMISTAIASKYGGKHCKAMHVNMVLGALPELLKTPLLWLQGAFMYYTPEEMAGLERSQWFDNSGKGYFHEQTTQPQTLGYALADSPVGLLAWIYEKMRNWTDDFAWTDDEILTWVSLYWFSCAGPAASLRIYYEWSHSEMSAGIPPVKNTHVGLSVFPKDIFVLPLSWAHNYGPRVVFTTRHTSGGHFAAYEKPEELAGDLFKMFGKGGGAFGVVKDADGYAPST